MCYSFRVRRPDRLLEIRTAAYLAAQGFSQKEIAETLGVSQPGVSRLVKQAIAVGCLKETSAYTFVSDDIPEEQLQAIQTAAVPTELTTELRRLGDRLGVSVPAVRVLRRASDARAPATVFAGRRVLGRDAGGNRARDGPRRARSWSCAALHSDLWKAPEPTTD